MINKLTGRPTKVHCTGDILVSKEQLALVERIFQKNKIKFQRVDYEEHFGENRSLATMLELENGTDVIEAQRVLDGLE